MFENNCLFILVFLEKETDSYLLPEIVYECWQYKEIETNVCKYKCRSRLKMEQMIWCRLRVSFSIKFIFSKISPRYPYSEEYKKVGAARKQNLSNRMATETLETNVYEVVRMDFKTFRCLFASCFPFDVFTISLFINLCNMGHLHR